MIKTSPTNGKKSFVNLIERLSMKKLTGQFFITSPRPLFRLFSVFFKQTINFLQQISVKNLTSVQYTEPGFKPTTSQT